MEEGSEGCQWLPLKLEEGKHKPTNVAVFNLCNHLCIKYMVINSRESDKKFFISVGGGEYPNRKNNGKNKQKSPKKDRVNKLMKKILALFQYLNVFKLKWELNKVLAKIHFFYYCNSVKTQGNGILIWPW